jgi:oligopeptide transport system substrate-binding protein
MRFAVRAASRGVALLLLLACVRVGEPPSGVLRINLGTEPPTLDWTRATDSVSITVIEQLMRGLTRLGPDLRPVPALAERWDVSPDGHVYTFHLREGVVWTDGVRLTAEQFVYGWRRLLDPETAAEYAYFLFPVRGAREFNAGKLDDPERLGVRAIDERTLQVELEVPLIYFPSLTTFMATFPARKDVIERHGDRWTEPENIVTLGPFRLASWDHEYKIELLPNPGYWAGPPPLERVVAYMVGEGSTRLILFEQNILDLVRVPPLEIRRFAGHPGYRRLPALRGYYYGFNTEKPPFDDARVRRAFSMGVDREELPKVLRGGELPAAYWIPPGMPNHNPDIGLEFDPDGARRLLAEAGIEPEALPPIRIVFNHNEPTHRLVAENIQEQWRRHLGVSVELDSREWKVFLKELVVDPPPVYRLGWGADFPDPDNFMNLFASYSDNNHTRWGNPRFDRLVAEAARERDPARRQSLYDEAQRILCEEDVPIVPLFVSTINLLVADRVTGFEPNPMDLLFLDEVRAR